MNPTYLPALVTGDISGVLWFTITAMIVCAILYFVPTAIAYDRKAEALPGIALLNIFLG